MMPNNPDFQEFLQRLTSNAHGSLRHADEIARGLGSAYIGTEHLLLGVLAQDTSMGAKLLEGAGVTLDRARLALNLTPKALVINMGAKGLSETVKLTLKMAYDVLVFAPKSFPTLNYTREFYKSLHTMIKN